MDAELTKATLAEKNAHTELMLAHAGLMKAQTRQCIAASVDLELMNESKKNKT